MLKGLGTAMALPLLEAMLPAVWRAAPAAARDAEAAGVLYVPNGVNMADWTPGRGVPLRIAARRWSR